MLTRRTFLSLTAALPGLTLTGLPALAATPEIYAPGGVAINGYDPVAYFQMSKPVKGSAAHAVSWKGATWLFSSVETQAEFQNEPAKYAPKYGGYCAYALSRNAIAKTSPEAWTVAGGKLYLNYDLPVRSLWQQDIPGNIAKADANWPAVLQG